MLKLYNTWILIFGCLYYSDKEYFGKMHSSKDNLGKWHFKILIWPFKWESNFSINADHKNKIDKAEKSCSPSTNIKSTKPFKINF